MTARVAGLWRYPLKSHGREALPAVTLEAGRCLPWDRAWAVEHEGSQAARDGWSRCANFVRVAGIPALAAITAELDEAAEVLTLRHPDRPPLSFSPDREAAAFLDWVAPLMPEGRAAPVGLLRVPDVGLTDSAFASVSLGNCASHRAVAQKAGRALSPHRWRANVWIEGLGPWEEFEWPGRRVRLGGAVLEVRERAGRCEATAANPETGARDIDLLEVLETWGHRDFSVLAEVVEGGRVAAGDPVAAL